ncbi:hypothetical protein C8J56DRAFT_767977 [Mycena floridula]|nr:hypothetical protein C8J56DRAFT_767977 [Mycena floridula]
MSIIPGPHEPSLDEINHYLRPMISPMLRSWKHGTLHSQTAQFPHGRLARSAIALAVFDLPGGRKVTGKASHSFKNRFCSLCALHKDDINNIDCSSWKKTTRDEQKKCAEEWRDAKSDAVRDQLFEANGIRWSVLWELPYFDLTKMVIIDGMHNLFLGLVQHHFRVILGINDSSLSNWDPRSSKQIVLNDNKVGQGSVEQINETQS